MPEAPETPAPVFAIRAFKSALFGTPGVEDEGEGEHTLQLKEQKDGQQHSASDSLNLPSWNSQDTANTKNADSDTTANANTSPTKSILLTPGTASNRRKTVSFGHGVVDNERKRDTPSSKTSRTPPSSSGTVSSQWLSGSPEGKNKPRSKLTQTLLDARDKSPEFDSRVPETGLDPSPGTAPSTMAPTKEDGSDETVNLNEPRSESGKYWKAEFDSYRTKTSNEIKRLIQYRSAAKSFARKKDEEASRLAGKLRDEERRVSEMERHVSQLASTMVGEGANADKEQLVQDLTKQTALALQYKHRVNLLRKLLEKHGVVGNEVDDIGEDNDVDRPSEKATGEHRRTQQALGHANAKSEDQRTELSKLRNLAHSSEEKASKLEEENIALKHSLARIKQEMNKYESRRLEKEGRLKQREAKLETRVKDYRERLKKASHERRSREQEHHAREQDLRTVFEEERGRMTEEIHRLRTKLHNTGRATERYTHRPHTTSQDAQVQDFGPSQHYPSDNETDESDKPPSPSPRSKGRNMRHFRDPAADSEGADELNAEDDEELSPSENAHAERRLLSPTVANSGAQYRPLRSNRANTDSTAAFRKRRYVTDNRHGSQKRSQANASLRQLSDVGAPQQATVRGQLQAPVKYSLDAITGFPRAYTAERSARKEDDLATYQRAALTVDRMIAAQVRLKKKERARKARENEKENVAFED